MELESINREIYGTISDIIGPLRHILEGAILSLKTRVALIRAGRGFAAGVVALGATALASNEVREAIGDEPYAGVVFALIPAFLLGLDKLRRWVD